MERLQCGIYLRISREDGEEESNSITNQRQLLTLYIREHEELQLAGEWIDDGYSGSNYERPGFQGMLLAAAKGEIQCLICKDLSRLGREYIQTGRLLREVFPRLGLRFISVADHYDSARADFMEQSLLLPVMSLMNDAYCRDISRKVRLQQQAKRRAGEYIGAFACYGYDKSSVDGHVLTMDPEAAKIVRCIYLLRLCGASAEGIAALLNHCQIDSPRAYKRRHKESFRSGFDGQGEEQWAALSVRRILHNRMYTGEMIQGKDRKISYKLKERRKIPREQWIRVPEKVPVIIAPWVVVQVEQIRARRVKCRRGRLFCELFAGYRLTKHQQRACRIFFDAKNRLFQKQIVSNAFYQSEQIKNGIDRQLDECWQRLWFNLYVRSIEVSEGKILIRMNVCEEDVE